jgi:hypothetical protein
MGRETCDNEKVAGVYSLYGIFNMWNVYWLACTWNPWYMLGILVEGEGKMDESEKVVRRCKLYMLITLFIGVLIGIAIGAIGKGMG